MWGGKRCDTRVRAETVLRWTRRGIRVDFSIDPFLGLEMELMIINDGFSMRHTKKRGLFLLGNPFGSSEGMNGEY